MTNHDIAIWEPALGQMQLNRRRGKGDEYVGACPDCGGKDRFHIWPSDGETGRYWCRQCNRRGDGIDYLRWQRNMTFQQACEATGKSPTRRRTINVDTTWWKVRKPFVNDVPPTLNIDTSVSEVVTPVEPQPEPLVELATVSSPKPYSTKCPTCFKFGIDYDIAWCFSDGAYRNHAHLKSCPGYTRAACKDCESYKDGRVCGGYGKEPVCQHKACRNLSVGDRKL